MGTVRQLQELLGCTHQVRSDSDSTDRRGVNKWVRQAPRVGQVKGQPGVQGRVQVDPPELPGCDRSLPERSVQRERRAERVHRDALCRLAGRPGAPLFRTFLTRPADSNKDS